MATITATSQQPTLDSLYGLVRDDLAKVDSLIIARVSHEIPLIRDIASHIIASGGKRIRPVLTLISAQLCGYCGTRQLHLAATVEFIHTATLLHDDVVDDSALRRGLNTANNVSGNKASVLVGDFLLSQAFQMMVADGSLEVLRILSNASAVIAKGEVMQLMAEGELGTSTAHYLEVITAKTAVLFAAACEIGAVVSQHPQQEALRAFGQGVGIAFQLVDDALDYAANEATLGKTVGDDFREGKITLPIILAYEAGSEEEKQFWQRTLGERQQTADDLAHALTLFAKYNTIEKTLTMARDYGEHAKVALELFPASPAKSAMVALVDFCIARAY